MATIIKCQRRKLFFIGLLLPRGTGNVNYKVGPETGVRRGFLGIEYLLVLEQVQTDTCRMLVEIVRRIEWEKAAAGVSIRQYSWPRRRSCLKSILSAARGIQRSFWVFDVGQSNCKTGVPSLPAAGEWSSGWVRQRSLAAYRQIRSPTHHRECADRRRGSPPWRRKPWRRWRKIAVGRSGNESKGPVRPSSLWLMVVAFDDQRGRRSVQGLHGLLVAVQPVDAGCQRQRAGDETDPPVPGLARGDMVIAPPMLSAPITGPLSGSFVIDDDVEGNGAG